MQHSSVAFLPLENQDWPLQKVPEYVRSANEADACSAWLFIEHVVYFIFKK